MRVALVGCGAIAESYYLPVLASDRAICSRLHLVDTDEERLASAARRYRIAGTATRSLDAVLDRIDAAVVATPPDSHAPLARALIAAGRHVFCEKPLAASPEEAEGLVRAADAAGVVLMTNNYRRSVPAFRRVAELVRDGALGRLVSVAWSEGVRFNWPTRSGFYFTQRGQGGLPPPGILLDIGSHVVDLIGWWCGGAAPAVVECRTDSFGGPEARARLLLDLDGTEARIELSWYRRLDNRYVLRFERGVIEGAIGEGHRFRLRQDGGARPVTVHLRGGRGGLPSYAAPMLAGFVAAARGEAPPIVAGRDVLPSIRAIAEAYRQAEPFDAPWLPRRLLAEAFA